MSSRTGWPGSGRAGRARDVERAQQPGLHLAAASTPDSAGSAVSTPSSLRGTSFAGLWAFAVTRACRLYPVFVVSIVTAGLTWVYLEHNGSLNFHIVSRNPTMIPGASNV